MDISFHSRKLATTIASGTLLQRRFGQRLARAVRARLALLAAAESLALVPSVPPVRCHQLHADRDEQFAVDLVHPYRLVFAPDHDPMPRLPDGGINRSAVTAVVVLDIVDYH
ncbi:MAG: type II toxin-antitoxin system RelE/ParE family toxin [Salinarimonas sp.]